MKAAVTIGALLIVCGISFCSIADCSVNERSDARETLDRVYHTFLSPGAEYRGKPFWSWNGKLEKDELIRQIHVLHEMGFGGFFMHSRTGLATEYLGDEWFELIDACADEAEKLGLEAWLYDEDRWPSGSAGGKATVEPEYRMKYLRLTIVPGADFVWKDDLVAAFSCHLDGLNYSECQPLSKTSLSNDYKDKTVLEFTTEEMAAHPFYNGNTYLDTLNRKATENFIRLTHEKYKERCGDRLGTSLKGIFTDEPHRGMVMCKNVSQGSIRESEMLTPWTPGLFDAFKATYGYDLVSCLPELYLRPEGRRISKVKWQYMELIQQMFLDNWLIPIHEWCGRNNMILTGHALHEDTLGSQAVPCGSLMRFYEYMDYPGVDVLTEGNRNYWIVKQLSSAARQLGKKWLMSELYGCTGWQMPFAGHKAVGDWQSLFGINLRCHHLSWYTMEGEAKRDYPASISYQSAWYEEYKTVETYFSRMQSVQAEGEPCCDILVLNPVESAWAQIYAGWASWLSATAPEVVALDQKYQQLFHWLCGAQLDFDYGDEDYIKRKAQVETIDGQTVLRIGHASYKTVVVSGLETIRSTTLEALKRFLDAGGTVIVLGDPPAFVDAEPSHKATELFLRARKVAFDRERVIQALASVVERPVEITDAETSVPLTEIFCQAREDDFVRYIMALNVNREKGFDKAKVRIKGSGVIEEWNCLTGERLAIPATANDGYLEFVTDFPACGERLYILAPEATPGVKTKPVYTELKRVACEGPYVYTLDEPNICVLDRAEYQLDGGSWRDGLEILKVDRTVRNELGLYLRGGEMLQPWFAGKQERSVKTRLGLRFQFAIERMPQEAYLMIERPELFQITVNEHELSSSDIDGWAIDTCLKRIKISNFMLQFGINRIELQIGFHEGIDLEAIYLAGPFGVRIDGTVCTLTGLPEQLKVGDVTAQGLPFYSGRIRYELPPLEPPQDGTRMVLAVPEFEGACVRIESDSAKPKMIAWPPYEIDITDVVKSKASLGLDVVLTRRNTFGPLHQIPLKAGAYGPGNWVTEGKNFSENYMLYPAGLLGAPVVKTLSIVSE